MNTDIKPIFFSKSSRRWTAFKGVMRLLGLILAIGVVVAAIAILNDPFLNETKGVSRPAGAYHAVLNPDKITTLTTTENRAYHSLRAHFGNDADVQYRYRNTCNGAALQHATHDTTHDITHDTAHHTTHHFTANPNEQIRAGFFVNWDIRSWYSLRNHIGAMTMVLPEWFSLADTSRLALSTSALSNTDSLITANVDARALAFMRQHKVAIVPILSNYDGKIFNEPRLRSHLATRERRTKLIQATVRMLQQYGFAGVNIDFENLNQTSTQRLVALFQAELYATLHPMNLLVTQDIAPFDPHTTEFARHNDYLFLMAYDLHYSTSEPGAIAPIKWIERALADIAKRTSPQKEIGRAHV